MVSAHPALDCVLPFPRNRFRRALRSPGRALGALRWATGLRRGGWEIAVDCQGLARSAFFARCTRASRRVGWSDAREFGWFHYTQPVEVAPGHAVERMLGLVDALGIPRVTDLSLHAPPDALEWFEEAPDAPQGRYAVLAPRSRWASKEWPADRWCELALRAGTFGLDELVFIGSPSEAPSVEALARRIEDEAATRSITSLPRLRVLAGRTTVGQLMAVIRGSSLVVASDSAALHMAVGFARPLVALFGPTDPAEVGPWGYDSSVLRAPSARGGGHDYRLGRVPDSSMLEISLDHVLEAMAAAEGRVPS